MESLIGTIDLKESLKANFENNTSKASPLLVEKTQQAFAQFESLGFPTTRNEDWKYTNFQPVLKKQFVVNSNNTVTNEELSQLLIPTLEGNIIIIVNGVYRSDLSSIKEDATNLEIKNLQDFSTEFVDKYVNKTLAVNDAFTALNTSNAAQSLVLRVPKGKVVDMPVYIYYVTTGLENTFAQPRLLLVAEENSEVKVVELYQKMGRQAVFTNSFTDIYLEKNAFVTYYKIQPNTEETYHVGTTQVVHLAKSVFSATTITLGGTIIRNNVNIVLNAAHCDSTLNGLYITNGTQHVDNHSLVDHAMPNCLSNELYKGVLNGKSTGVFNGKIFVREDAQKTNAFQSNKSILLSNDATMNTKPQLEIFADDVKCSHGATIGQLDEEPLFYLRSRGLSEATARIMLVAAFAKDIIEHVKIEPLKDLLINMLEEVLVAEQR